MSSDEERRKELDRIARGNRRWAVVRVLSVAMLVCGVLAVVLYFTFTWTGMTLDDIVWTPPDVEAPRQQPGRLSPWLALPFLLPLALFIVYRAWWHRRADQFLDRRTTDETASVRPLFVTGRASQLFHTIPLLRAARSLRKHEMVDSPDLDVEATVDATVRRGGHFDPILRKRPRLPEDLALVDRAGPRDQRAQLVDALLDGLQQEGLFISRYDFHRRSASVLSADDVRAADEARLSGRAVPGHRLWIFTEGDGFIDPFTGATPRWVEQFEAWSSRTVFTFEATANWGSREGALANAGFRVLPASETGLADSADPTSMLRRETTNLVSDLPPLVPALLTEDPR